MAHPSSGGLWSELGFSSVMAQCKTGGVIVEMDMGSKLGFSVECLLPLKSPRLATASCGGLTCFSFNLVLVLCVCVNFFGVGD